MGVSGDDIGSREGDSGVAYGGAMRSLTMRIELNYIAALLAAECAVGAPAAPPADGSSSGTWAGASANTNAIALSLETISPTHAARMTTPRKE